ncbi:MAG TPA: hypothetical protein VFH39_03800 [Candidatus Saccharimonadales bacterium]|jgi:A/G-specific adenine glycosylase|nr:hypothetical protein [Candidatus Saccharimonadales bacterium]
MRLTPEAITAFQDQVLAYYHARGRHDLPWRRPEPDGSFDSYKILVSELMLQQTQVSRVVPKYTEFLRRFPSAGVLAAAPLGEVLRAWSGLGYNRRAKYLWQAARYLVDHHGGVVPDSNTELVKLPGVGKNTAGSILAYAYDRPVVFVETNIRTAYIHHFFGDRTDITDAEILVAVEATLLRDDPRVWYWALMDYGAHLKQTIGNLNKLSKTYTRQSAFAGSRRQLRGKILRTLGAGPAAAGELKIEDERLPAVLDELSTEGLIRLQNGRYTL